jgi:porin
VPPAKRLYNFWLQQNLFDDVLSVRAGLMNVDAEFMTSLTASTFVNTTFGWLSWTGFDLLGGGPAIRCRRRGCG